MNKRNAVVVFSVAILVFLGWAFLLPQTRSKPTLSEYLPEEYTSYSSPRADMGPGTVFVGSDTPDGILIDRVICDELYLAPDIQKRRAELALPNTASLSQDKAEGLLEFLSAPFGGQIAASGSVTTDFEVTWGQVFELKFGNEQAFLENGEARHISKACNERIDQFKQIIEANNTDNKVYVIVATIAAEGLEFTVKTNRTSDLDGEAKLPVEQGSSVEAQANVQMNESEIARMSFEQPMNLGYSLPWTIDEWLPTDLTSPSIVRVRASPSNKTIAGFKND